MVKVLDFSGAPPSSYPADVVGVVRYIAPRRSDGRRRGKCISEAELDGHKKAHRQVGFVFEDAAGNSLHGAPQGAKDGGAAVREMRVLGVPARVAVYAAVDQDTTPAQLPIVAAYLHAFHQPIVGAGYRRGVYGEYDVVATMLRDGQADLGWQTVAWSNRLKATGVPGVALFQRAQQIVVSGTTCDVNEVWQDDWGQWDFRLAPAVPTPTEGPVSLGLDDDDDRRAAIRRDCWTFWGMAPSPTEQAGLLATMKKVGSDLALAAITDHPKALAHRKAS